jgi:hypothetical protein
MSRAAFDKAANHVHKGWWLTGEDLIHHKEVTGVEGWELYGRHGHARLTDAQRALTKLARERSGREPRKRGEAEDATPASKTFEAWLYADETKAASRQFVGAFIRRHAAQLVRFTD